MGFALKFLWIWDTQVTSQQSEILLTKNLFDRKWA